LKFCWFK